MTEEIKIIRVKRGTTAQWAEEAAPLMAGEWGYDEATGEVKIGDGSTAFASLPAVSVVGHNHSYTNLTDKPTLGTAAAKNVGTSEGDVVELASGGKLPAVDGSQLTNLPAAGISDVVDDTTPQLGGDLDINGNKIVSASNGDVSIAPDGTGMLKMEKGAYHSNYISNGTLSCTIDWRASNKQLITPSGNRTYTFTAPTGVTSLTLVITVTGSRTLYWPAAVSWRGGAPATTAAGTYIATFFWDGTNYFGTCTGKD